METKTTQKPPKKTAKKPAPKRISKTWEAVLALKGTGKILDMEAVLK